MSASVTAATTMTSRTASAVRTLDLTKTYGSGTTLVRALRSVTLDIPSGRFTAIMGASGSGKSTLLHCITGLDSPTSGRRRPHQATSPARRVRVSIFQPHAHSQRC